MRLLEGGATHLAIALSSWLDPVALGDRVALSLTRAAHNDHPPNRPGDSSVLRGSPFPARRSHQEDGGRTEHRPPSKRPLLADEEPA